MKPAGCFFSRWAGWSPSARQLGQARALLEQMPDTYGLLLRGEISEHVSTIVITETSHLTVEDRRLVDKKLVDLLPGLGPKRAHATTRRLAIEVDPAGAVRRASNAPEGRWVGIRPAPDTMTILSALLPCEQAVAAYAALHRAAEAAIGAGDERSRGQIMSDTLVERLTGQTTANAVSAEIGLVMTDAALFAGDDSAADMTGYGPIPADVAREIARGTDDPPGAAQAQIFLRRLFTDPQRASSRTATRGGAGSTACSLGCWCTAISIAVTRTATLPPPWRTDGASANAAIM